MKSLHLLAFGLSVLLFGSGCQRAVLSSADVQQKFFQSLRAPNPAEEKALRCAHYHSLVGRFDLAQKELEQAIAKDSHNSRLLNALGNCYDKMGQYVRAQESYEKILAADSENMIAKNNLGYSCYLFGDLSRAEKIFQEILSKNPRDTLAQNNLGLILCRQNKEAQALQLWQKTAGEVQAREKLTQVMAFLGKPGSDAVSINLSPQTEKSAVPLNLAKQTVEVEKESRQFASMSKKSKAVKDPMPESDFENPQQITAKKNNPAYLNKNVSQAPQPTVEEVKMIIQPASYSPVQPEKAVMTNIAPALPASPDLAEPQNSRASRHARAREIFPDDSFFMEEVNTPKRHYYRRPLKHCQRYCKPKIVTYQPEQTAKPIQAFKNCLSNVSVHQKQKSSGKQDAMIF